MNIGERKRSTHTSASSYHTSILPPLNTQPSAHCVPKTILIKYNSRVTSQCKGKSKTYTLGVPGYYQKSIQFPKPQTGIPSFLKRNLQRLNLIWFHLESRLISCKLYRICSFLHHITLDNRCQFLTEN